MELLPCDEQENRYRRLYTDLQFTWSKAQGTHAFYIGGGCLINNTDIETSSEVEENDKRRMLVKDTDIGKRLIGEIDDLHKLLENYRRL